MIPRVSATVTITKSALQTVFGNLKRSGFRLVGPTPRDGAVVLDEISAIEELPIGWVDIHRAGRYELRETDYDSFFTANLGAMSWKQYLQPPRMKLFSAKQHDGTFTVTPADNRSAPYACIGVRACDIQALGALDRVFMGGPYPDPTYSQRRERMFILAVNCGRANDHCFCTSTRSGPRATSGFDLAATELPNALVLEVGSEAGSEALIDTGWIATTAFDQGRASQIVQQTERQIARQVKMDDLPALLFDNLEHPRWKDVAVRCLSCGNCTMVCPTCFCSTVTDSIELEGECTERCRVWDSCYSAEFSHVHGGNLRPTVRSRYRQWLTHKFASWKEQFGTLGCVGCGRCLTWCPAGIDILEEIKAIRGTGT